MSRFSRWIRILAWVLALVCALSSACTALATTATGREDSYDCEEKGHKWGPWQIDPWGGMTCGDRVYRFHTCQYCSESEGDETYILPHAWKKWEVEYPPKDGQPGMMRRECDRCGKIEYKYYYDDDTPAAPVIDEPGYQLSIDVKVLQNQMEKIYHAGDELVFVLTLTNSGTGDMKNPYAGLYHNNIMVDGYQLTGLDLKAGKYQTFGPAESCTYSYIISDEDALSGSVTFTAFGFAEKADGSAVYSGLADITLTTEANPAISIYVMSYDEKTEYSSGDVMHFDVYPQNIGDVKLYNPIVTVKGQNSEQSFIRHTSILPLDTTELGAEYGCDITYTVTDDDVLSGTFMISFIVAACVYDSDSSAEGWVESPEWQEYHFAVKPEPALALKVDYDPGTTAVEGGKIGLTMTVTNTGNVPVFDGYVFGSKTTDSYNHDLFDALAPGESVTFPYTILIGHDEVQGANVTRSFYAHAKWGKPDEENEYPVVDSNDVYATFPVTAANPSISLAVDYDHEAYAVQDVPFELTMTVTNTGNVPIHKSGIFGYGALFIYDANDLDVELMPNESVTCTVTIVPDPYHAAAGKVECNFHARGEWGEADPEEGYPIVISNYEYLTIPMTDADAKISLDVDYAAVPPLYEGGQRVLTMTVTNTGSIPLFHILFSRGMSPEMALDDISEVPYMYEDVLKPGESVTFPYTLVASPEDAAAGSAERCFFIQGHWGDADEESEATLVDDGPVCVSIPVVSDKVAAPILLVWPDYYGRPENHDGDDVCFDWTVLNVSDVDCYLTELYWNAGQESGNLFEVPPYDYLSAYTGSVSGYWVDPVRADRVVDGKIEYNFVAYVMDANGNHVPTNVEVIKVPVTNDDPWIIPPKTVYDIDIEKVVVSSSDDPNGYAVGEYVEYLIRVSNNTGDTLYSIDVSDPLKGSNEDAYLGTIDELGPYCSYYFSFMYMVTPGDMAAGRVDNIAIASWIDPVSFTRVSRSSKIVSVPVLPVTGPVITKSVDSAPPDYDDGSYYAPGDLIVFEIFVDNYSPCTYTDLDIYDPLHPDGFIGHFDTLAPGESQQIEFYYYATDGDAINGFVCNDAILYYEYEGMMDWVYSNEVEVPANFPPQTPGIISDIDFWKEVTSDPGNGEYYMLDEVITYEIHLENNGEADIANIVLYDWLEDSGDPIAYHTYIPAGGSVTFGYDHIVTEEDLAAKEVANYAWMDYDIMTMGWILSFQQVTNVVISPCGTPPRPTPPEMDPDPGEECCERYLLTDKDGEKIYLLHHCQEHGAIETQLEADLAAAGSDQEKIAAYGTARTAWTDAIGAMYDRYLACANTAARAVILQEKAQFFRFVALREAELKSIYGDGSLRVCAEINTLLENHCADMCLEYNKPDQLRFDSEKRAMQSDVIVNNGPKCSVRSSLIADNDVTTIIICCADHKNAGTRAGRLQQLNAVQEARFSTVNENGRALIRSSRAAMNDWLTAREAMLRLVYSRSSTVNEVITQTIEYFAVLECGR